MLVWYYLQISKPGSFLWIQILKKKIKVNKLQSLKMNKSKVLNLKRCVMLNNHLAMMGLQGWMDNQSINLFNK